MRYLEWAMVGLALVTTIIGLTFWKPRQYIGETRYSELRPEDGIPRKTDLKLYSPDNTVPVAVYETRILPLMRNEKGEYSVRLIDGSKVTLYRKYLVGYMTPVEMAKGNLVIFNTVYVEDKDGNRKSRIPAIESGLPAFDPLIGAGYLVFDYPESVGPVKLVLTYAVIAGADTVYGPAFAEVNIPGFAWH